MKFFLAGCSLLVTCGLANASIMFTLGNVPSGDVNILLNTGQTGNIVQGTASGMLVDFSSTQSLLEPSSGQARVSANPEGTSLTNLKVYLDNGGTYGDIIINPFTSGSGAGTGGPATVTVVSLLNGAPEANSTFSYNIGNGSNFLTIVASSNESIVSTSISVAGGINDLRQPRISGPFTGPGGQGGQVPEPGTMSLLGGGLLGIGLFARKFRKA